MITADSHVHSDFSSDSQAPMEQMIERAILLGMKKLYFTDHMDYDYPPMSGLDFLFDPTLYFIKLEELKCKYHKQIQLFIGIELGLQPHLSDQLKNLVNRYPFDFMIGSSHVVDHEDPYYPKFWENRTKKEGIHRYFETILENCKSFQDFHTYGHIDYIIRYVPGQSTSLIKEDYLYSDYKDVLDEVLKTLIHHGIALEINTAGYKYGLGYAHPKQEVLKRYRELGGELITIGSDAHKPEHLCYDFHLIPDVLLHTGFQYYTTFEQRKPIFIKL